MSSQDVLPYRLPNHEEKRLLDPHVVIIGAGASIAVLYAGWIKMGRKFLY